MEIIVEHDLDKVLQSKIGRFAIGYWSTYIKGNRKLKPKDNFEKAFYFFFNVAGKLAVYYLHIATQLYFRIKKRVAR